MKRLVLGVLLASLVVYLWGFLFWTTPLSMWAVETSPDEEAVRTALVDHLPVSGTYFIPGDMEDPDAWSRRHREGPIATIHVQRMGSSPMAPQVFALGFVHMVLSFAFVGGALWMLPASMTFGRRVALVAVLGLGVAVWSNLGNPVWFSQPWPHHISTAAYDVVAWLFAGSILGYFSTPRRGEG